LVHVTPKKPVPTTRGSSRSNRQVRDSDQHAIKHIADNRKARHDYDIIESLECGIVLQGSEVKSLRAGRTSLRESFARIDNGEVWVYGIHIAPYDFAHGFGGHDPDRPKKLLLHRYQIDRLAGLTQQRSLTLVPLSMYFKSGTVKLELALARGRKLYDVRRVVAEREAAREARREIANAMKRSARYS